MSKNETATIRKGFEELADHYLRQTDRFTLEELRRKPSEDEWSLGQMYLHLVHSALHMQLSNAQACLAASGEEAGGAAEKTEDGRRVFEMGGFPPVRIQVPPSKQYTPPLPERKEQITEGLEAVRLRMRELEPAVGEAQGGAAVPHPRFGGLNAAEWYKLVEMHFRHHLLQEARLIKELKIEQ